MLRKKEGRVEGKKEGVKKKPHKMGISSMLEKNYKFLFQIYMWSFQQA